VWSGHESVNIMSLPIILWKRDHTTHVRTTRTARAVYKNFDRAPRQQRQSSSSQFFHVNNSTTTTTTPYQMSRGPPTTLPVGLSRKRREKRSYDKFGVGTYVLYTGIVHKNDDRSVAGRAHTWDFEPLY